MRAKVVQRMLEPKTKPKPKKPKAKDESKQEEFPE